MSILAKWLESLSIDVHITELCTRETSPRSTCNACVDHCRHEAILFDKKKVRIDSSRCFSCGECIISCPVSAINGTMMNRTLKNGLLYYEQHYCPTVKELLIYHKRGISGIAIPSDWYDEEWEKIVDETNSLLNKLGLKPFFFEYEEYVNEPAVTRREFIVFGQSKGAWLAKELTPAAWRQNSKKWSLPHHYQDVQFFEVEFNQEKCTVCKGCFNLCSQKVFNLTDSKLTIDHQKCTNCSLCEDVCPEGAIKINKNVSEKFQSDFPLAKHKCKRCQTSYLSFNKDADFISHEVEPSLCHVCSKKPSDWLMP